MTPEERAQKIVDDGNWADIDYIFDGEDERRVDSIDRDQLRNEITAAIHAAIEAEREACARVLDSQALQAETNNNTTALWVARILRDQAVAIRARGVERSTQEISPKSPD